jgi:phytoene desaturase
MPGLRQHVVVKHWMTPFDFRDRLAARYGAAFSVAPELTQSAWFRPHNRDPHIPGLYLVGAGTHPGAGVPGVINSAKATSRLVVSDLMGKTV